MYESEANESIGFLEEVPKQIRDQFAQSRSTVKRRSLIPWGEHCTECVWPTCYSTCDLYSPREDGRCRRFARGMERIPCHEALNGYLLRISFKKWAKLWSPANTLLHSLSDADKSELVDLQVASCIQILPASRLRNFLSNKRYSWKKRGMQKGRRTSELPNCMLIECHNPNSETVDMTFTVRTENSPIPFQALLPMIPGFNRHRISVRKIAERIDLASCFSVELTPNEITDGCTLYFGAMDFVLDSEFSSDSREPTPIRARSTAKPPICKCVVWDLDNTLWDGILVEDGQNKLRLKARIREILRSLDERGILISAVSKNNENEAVEALKSFGIYDYFLFPQLSWLPKSQGIQAVASELNIGLESLLFIDDSPFERAQVSTVCPEVTTIDASEYLTILDRPECQLPVTDESRKRRVFYREQQRRDSVRKRFQGDYLQFLKDCNLRLSVRKLTASNLVRVHELTQRTNQMNFSGNRYTRQQLECMMSNGDIETFVLDCEDRYGAYGTIGFSTVNCRDHIMTDLMFSCRVQAKRIEHAFMSYILREHRRKSPGSFYVDYRKTDRNATQGKVFEEFGFECSKETNGVSRLFFPEDKKIPDDGIVEIILEGEAVINPTDIQSSSVTK